MTLESVIEHRIDDHVRIDSLRWLEFAQAAHQEGFTYFCFLSGIDWMINPDLNGEKHFDESHTPASEFELISDIAVRLVGGDSRFSVFAMLRDVVGHRQVIAYTDLADSLTVDSWTSVFPGADWHEREAWEMFGFEFAGHPGLRHIYLPEGFEGNPLRKDFALAARIVRPWPGLVDMEEMPKKPEESQ